MLSVEDWAEIRRLRRAEGMPIAEIARVLGISRNTVKAVLASDNPPKYVRAPQGSGTDAFEPRIRELLAAYPSMPATVIAERTGWLYSVRTLSGKVAQWRPAYLPPDPASRTAYAAGEIAQCDFWFPPVQVPCGSGQVQTAKQLPVLTMVTGYARWASAVLIPSWRAEDLFAGWWQLISGLGAVPACWSGTGGDRPVAGAARHPGRESDRLPAARSRGQEPGRAAARLPGAVVPARPGVRVPGGLQRPAAAVPGPGEHPAAPGAGLRRRTGSRRTGPR